MPKANLRSSKVEQFGNYPPELCNVIVGATKQINIKDDKADERDSRKSQITNDFSDYYRVYCY